MIDIKTKIRFISSIIAMLFLTIQFASCGKRHQPKSENNSVKIEVKDTIKSTSNQNRKPVFEQVHANLNGMVSQFVRKMYQDKHGNIWFGTNDDGIILYDGSELTKCLLSEKSNHQAIRGIEEDKRGNVWFATSEGLVKYDGKKFTVFAEKEGLTNNEIWGFTIDRNGLIWVGTTGGVCRFDGKRFTSFELPKTKVENARSMLSKKLVFNILEDKNGVMWFVTDGNGIFKYNGKEFTHLTKENGLTDNSVADLLEDKKGNIWIGTFYGGVSKFNGSTYSNFTKNGQIEGMETYNFCEDTKGNIWFSAENYGVYKFDGSKFTQFTTANGIASNTIQSIFEDQKGQMWFGTWQGISLYDGKTFSNASDKEPWTK